MAEYTAKSLLLSFRWAAKPASQWAGEIWQTHLRCLVRGTDPYDLDSGRQEGETFKVADSSASRTVDIWNVTQGWAGAGGLSDTVITDNDINGILAATKTWLVATKAYLVSEYVFESVRVYPMLAGGGSPFRPGVSATAPIIAVPTSTTVNPASTGAMPPDAAVAVSFSTGTRGPSGRGRMFLGSITSQALASTGLIDASAAQTYAEKTRDLLEDLRAIEGSGANVARFTPVVYTSRPNKSGENANTGSVINLVRISDEFDTQRRRDRQRRDVYTSYPLT